MRRLVWIVAFALALSLSPLDRWLDGTMPRLVLLAIPVWATLGILAIHRTGWVWSLGNPHGLTGLAWALGAFAFWMIPRSVDAIRISSVADQLMHASIFLAGAALAASWRGMPFVIRGVLGIYGAAMTIALGFVYTSYSALLCGTFNLAQQRLTGSWLLRFSPAIVLLVIVTGVRSLRAASRRGDSRRVQPRPPVPGPGALARTPLEQEVLP